MVNARLPQNYYTRHRVALRRTSANTVRMKPVSQVRPKFSLQRSSEQLSANTPTRRRDFEVPDRISQMPMEMACCASRCRSDTAIPIPTAKGSHFS